MIEVIGVRFRGGCKEYYFDPHGIEVRSGQYVIVEMAQGSEYAQCLTANHGVDEKAVVQPLRPLIRIATDGDRRTAEYNRGREKDAFALCQRRIAERALDMKLVRVESNFDGNKIVFFFTSEGRVDFRELVRDLAGVLHARIELRQIGVRDEAKMLGGLGICGRPFCCTQFLDDFVPVSIKMAKTQSLSLNPTKISGTCGRLMCCLKYEQNAYEDAMHRMPKNDSFVLTPDGPGNISAVNLLRETLNVRLDDAPEIAKCYHNCEVCVLRSGKGSRDGIEIPRERPKRYVPSAEETAADESVSPSIGPNFAAQALESAELVAFSDEYDEENDERRVRKGNRNRRTAKGRGERIQNPNASVQRRADAQSEAPFSEKKAEKPRSAGKQTQRSEKSAKTGKPFFRPLRSAVRQDKAEGRPEKKPEVRQERPNRSEKPFVKQDKTDSGEDKRRFHHHRGGRSHRRGDKPGEDRGE